MAFTRIDRADYNGKGVIGLPDAPQLSTNAMQEKFEEISLDVIIPKHNTLIDELESATGASNIGTKNGNVQSEIDAFDGKVAGFNGDISQLKSDMTQAQSDIATLQSGVNANKTDITALQSDNTTNKADIATNKANITTLQNENTTNKANITKNANDISALQTSVTTNANNIASLQNDNTTNKADIASLKSDNVTLKGKAHVHANKGVIDALSKDSATGNLMFEGNPISGGGSGNTDSYGHVKVGSVTIDASGDDTIELVAGSNVTLTPNANSKSVTISASGGGGGTSTGDMLKSEFVLPGGTGQVLSAKEADHATSADNATSANSASTATIADKAMAMFDGTNEIPTNQLMQKKDYDADDDGVVDNASHATNADNVGNASTSVLEGLSDNSGSLNYNGNALMLEAAQLANQAKLGEFVVNQKGNVKELALHSNITTKLSKVDTTDNLSVELAKKINKPASATDGQVLTYNGTNNEWEAQDSKGGAGKQVKSCEYAIERWLRFDPSNRKGLIIKAGTSIRNSQGNYIDFDSDTSVDLTSVITTVGEDYYVYMLDDGSITASLTSATAPLNSVRIGRFHSLCVAVGTCTMIVPPSGIAVGSNYLVKSYRQDEDLDFFNLYNKSVTATGTNNETLAHPLSGFEAGAILPESVMCLSFHSGSLFDDGQVYDKDTDAFIDIYLQSGIGLNTRSKYGATHTVSRTQGNHMVDMRQVGKKLLSDGEFESASIGSNQATNIQGSADKGTVGGHIDTANRRMISAIGVEEMCGYLWQWTRDVSSTGGSSWATTDSNGSFGQEYGTPFVLLAGGSWVSGSSCGSRSRDSNSVRSDVYAHISGRGLSRVVRGV